MKGSGEKPLSFFFRAITKEAFPIRALLPCLSLLRMRCDPGT